MQETRVRKKSGFCSMGFKFQDSHQDPGHGFKLQFPSFKIHTEIQVRVSRCNFQVSRFTPRSGSGFQDAISKFQDSNQDPGQGFKLQFPSFKIHNKIQVVRVSSCNFQGAGLAGAIEFCLTFFYRRESMVASLAVHPAARRGCRCMAAFSAPLEREETQEAISN